MTISSSTFISGTGNNQLSSASCPATSCSPASSLLGMHTPSHQQQHQSQHHGTPQHSCVFPPHRGSLSRATDALDADYVVEILIPSTNHSLPNDPEAYPATHDLVFTRHDFEFAQHLFTIMDTESQGFVHRTAVQDFATLRCPVLLRRDDDLQRERANPPPPPPSSGNSISSHCQPQSQPRDDNATNAVATVRTHTNTTNTATNGHITTFDEIWNSLLQCSKDPVADEHVLGVEGWCVLCRFVALAQYLEAKRRFSARHLQQTMRHRNSPRGSEMVMVDVPPREPPVPLTPWQLAAYERSNRAPLPLPEFDLDHCLVAAHDSGGRHVPHERDRHWGYVKITLFGCPSVESASLSSASSRLLSTSSSTAKSSAAAPASGKNLEFALSFTKKIESSLEEVIVRRSLEDLKWLDETFTAHKVLGGTLCGRILPPFPGSQSSGILAAHFKNDESVIKTSIKSTGGVINKAALVGVGKLRDAAKSLSKSFFGGGSSMLETSRDKEKASGSSASNTSSLKQKVTSSTGLSLSLRGFPETYYNPNSPICKARQLERYLNYLLEHPALSSSFPLNAVLQASQSGLEAAKVALEECTRATNELNQSAPHLSGDDKTIMLWPGVSPQSPSFTWVRTAAQAAMALKVHGMLETTGLQSASARLQHAALPSFGSAKRGTGWDDDEVNNTFVQQKYDVDLLHEGGDDFEEGVIRVDSDLGSSEVLRADDGYDLLPLPVPAPERRILSAGSVAMSARDPRREARFRYGDGSLQGQIIVECPDDDTGLAYLCEIPVDENIDKLREVIGSVDNTLSRCLASCGRIGKSRKDRLGKHIDIVKGLDSWVGMRGRFISQRALLKGVAGIEQSREVYEESDVALIDDISWQASLANSAVSAAEDVRKAVRLSRTAANAKAAASAAAFSAQTVCETGEFASIDEARAAQTRASIAHSHAIHAAVIEHEAKSVKRRAALALANDVKCWNIHRKRETLKSCLAYARSQNEATRRAVDAWICLKDGFISASVIPAAPERKAAAPRMDQHQIVPIPTQGLGVEEQDEVITTIFDNDDCCEISTPKRSIVAVEHKILSQPAASLVSSDTVESDSFFPFATASPIAEEDENECDSARDSSCHPGHKTSREDLCGNNDGLSASMQSLVDGLMSWGRDFDNDEDHFALPAGMAASIALEGSLSHGPDMV